MLKWFRRVRDPVPAVDRSADKASAAALAREVDNLRLSGDLPQARRLLDQALDRFPDVAEINFSAGVLLGAQAEYEEALDYFRLAGIYDPQHEPTVVGEAQMLQRLGRANEVESMCRNRIAAGAATIEARIQLALLYERRGDPSAALVELREALAIRSDELRALTIAGLLEAREFGQHQEGEALLRRALTIDPTYSDAEINLAWVLADCGRVEEALPLMERALARDPHDADTRLMRAYANLKAGNFSAGWADYRARFECTRASTREPPIRRWSGQPLGRHERLLIYGEQGLGDEIMFATCLPDVLKRAPSTTLYCNARLGRLFARAFERIEIVEGPPDAAASHLARRVSDFSFAIASGDLPALVRPTREAFSGTPILRVDPHEQQRMRDELRAIDKGPWIGVCWRGGAATTRGQLRSLNATTLGNLAARLDAPLLSLQHGDVAADLATLRRDRGITIHQLPDVGTDIDRLATAIASVDLVVSVCGTAIHLAGALGVPCVGLVPTAAEWRYGRVGRAMPWYSSVELLRQDQPNDWSPVFDAVAARWASDSKE